MWLTVVNRSRNRQRRSSAGDEACRSAALDLTCPSLHHTSITLLSCSDTDRPVRMTVSRQTFCFHVCQRQSCRSRLPPASVVCNKLPSLRSRTISQTIALCICRKTSMATCSLVAQGRKWLETSRDGTRSAYMKQLEKDAGRYSFSVEILSRVRESVPSVGSHDEGLLRAWWLLCTLAFYA